MRGEVDCEDGKLAVDVAPEALLLLPYANIAVGVGNHRGPKELVAKRSGDGQGRDEDSPGAVGASLGHEVVDEGGRGKGEEHFTVC